MRLLGKHISQFIEGDLIDLVTNGPGSSGMFVDARAVHEARVLQEFKKGFRFSHGSLSCARLAHQMSLSD